jgi:hypothetical protein
MTSPKIRTNCITWPTDCLATGFGACTTPWRPSLAALARKFATPQHASRDHPAKIWLLWTGHKPCRTALLDPTRSTFSRDPSKQLISHGQQVPERVTESQVFFFGSFWHFVEIIEFATITGVAVASPEVGLISYELHLRWLDLALRPRADHPARTKVTLSYLSWSYQVKQTLATATPSDPGF